MLCLDFIWKCGLWSEELMNPTLKTLGLVIPGTLHAYVRKCKYDVIICCVVTDGALWPDIHSSWVYSECCLLLGYSLWLFQFSGMSSNTVN
jgi:hypothetical protein